jgi:hypothetical protein
MITIGHAKHRPEELPFRHVQQRDRLLRLKEENEQGGHQRADGKRQKRAFEYAHAAAELPVNRGLNAQRAPPQTARRIIISVIFTPRPEPVPQ